MFMSNFIGRSAELATLNRFLQKKAASLIVIRGRRRIGKSRLIEEFAKDMTFYSFAGLAPTKQTTAQSQRDAFAQQLSEQTNLPEIKADDWSKLFSLLSDKISRGRIILLFDEISWMGSKDPDFLGKIKNAWDLKFKKNPKLIFVICGSASSWIEENILSSTGFLGRVSFTLTLEELPLIDCAQFWIRGSNNIAPYEMLKVLSVTGGVPRYLEEIDTHLSAEENINNLCFSKGGILTNEFEHIFSNVFTHKTPLYRQIIKTLVNGPKDTSEISQILKIDLSGLLSEYLEELLLAGFIKRDYTWHIGTGKDSKLSRYRLSDNYLRFYLCYIRKYKAKIDHDGFSFTTVSALPGWKTILGLQFENLVLNNRQAIINTLNISSTEIIMDNPFFQRPTTKQWGCQIDYMIQTKFDTLYICEIKFSKNVIGMDVVNEVQKKIDRLKKPKGFSCRPVLIHVNGITDELVESDYFTKIIDFSELMS